jgi:transposase
MVIEVGSQAGWIVDMAEALDIEIQVANPNHEGWRWKRRKRKTDRDDALMLARLSASGQLPLVYVPKKSVRQWRNLIEYRHTLVRRRTQIKNNIRSILERHAIVLPSRSKGWTQKSLEYLHTTYARPMEKVNIEHLWQGMLYQELEALRELEFHVEAVESKLDLIGEANNDVQRLRTIPGVGARLAEIVVATIDDSHRFENVKQVGAYGGLVPREFESGQMKRQGRITGRGNTLLRSLLTEVSWGMLRYNLEFAALFQRISRGDKQRRKIAVIAIASKLLIVCWAMLRDRSEYQPRRLAG